MLDLLESVRVDTIRINNLEERIARLRSSMERMTPLPSSQPGNSSRVDKLSGQVAKLDELEREMANRLVLLESKLKLVDKALDRLPPRQRAIVHLRLVEAMPWRVISKRVNYSRQHCRRIFCKAVEKMRHNVTF
jgi:RNA polymerase sigma factor (sigma-70 family)